MAAPEDFVSLPQFDNALKHFIERKVLPVPGQILGFDGNRELTAVPGPKWEMVAFPTTATSPGQPGNMAYLNGYLGVYVGDGTTHQWGFVFLVTAYPPV